MSVSYARHLQEDSDLVVHDPAGLYDIGFVHDVLRYGTPLADKKC